MVSDEASTSPPLLYYSLPYKLDSITLTKGTTSKASTRSTKLLDSSLAVIWQKLITIITLLLRFRFTHRLNKDHISRKLKWSR